MKVARFEIRRAEPTDVAAIAPAHLDSIRSLGPAAYPPNVVNDWGEGLTGELYLTAMGNGEVFFIATTSIDGTSMVLGFSSDYVIEGTTHGTSVYVRGMAARQGVGSALLRSAEAQPSTRVQVVSTSRPRSPASSSTRPMGSSRRVGERPT